MSTAKKKEIKQPTYSEWLMRMDAIAADLAEYPCPSCKGTIRTRRPPRGEVYDSATICPHCDGLHFKVVYPGGTVNADIMK